MWVIVRLKDFYKEKIKTLVRKLSKYLNCDSKNFSYGGNSPQGIIDDFINNINNIKKGDYVFISTSPMLEQLV